MEGTIGKKGRQLSPKSRKWIFYGCIVALPLLQFFVMYVMVNFNSLIMAFRSYDMEGDTWKFAKFTNFEALFYDIGRLPELRYGFINSLKAWLVSTLISIPLGLLFGYYIFKKFPLAGFYRVMLFMPSIISANILMIIFKYYADAFLPKILSEVFNEKIFGFLSKPNTRFPAILIYNVYIGFGVSVLMYTGAMGGISESVLEACELDGANMLQEFIFVVFPQIMGTVSVFVVTGIAGIFTNQLNLYSVYHAYADSKIYTIGYFLYRNIYVATSYASYPYNAALGVIITLIVAPVIILVRKLMRKLDPMED